MKSFLIVSIFAVIGAVLADDREVAKKYAKECVAETGIDAALAKKIADGEAGYVDDKCFAECWMKKVGFLKNGELQKDVIIEKLSAHMDKAQVEQLYKICTSGPNASSSNKCQTALNNYQCFRNQLKQQVM